MTWVKLGVDNTGYLYASIKSRGLQNQVLSFLDKGIHVDDFYKMKLHFLDHFKTFMGSISHAFGIIDPCMIFRGPVLNLDKQLDLIEPFSSKEINEAMFSIDSNKSLVLDGFGAGFFKASWSTVGKEIVAVNHEFFEHGNMSKVFSTAILFLIPKNANPSTANDF